MKPDLTDILIAAGLVLLGAGVWMLSHAAALVLMGMLLLGIAAVRVAPRRDG